MVPVHQSAVHCSSAVNAQLICINATCRQPNHPICIIKEAIIEYFEKNYPGRFTSFDDLYPIVSTKAVSQAIVTAVVFRLCELSFVLIFGSLMAHSAL